MAYTVFIDGEVGTTGLQIRERLASRGDIDLIRLPEERRKDEAARLDAFGAADISILCLPDAAVHDIVPRLGGNTRVIDASTAHRVATGWTYGFAEMQAGQRQAIATAARVSNPGCWSTGAIGLIAPLVAAGLVAPEEPLSVNGISGYTGGGKSMIAEFDSGAVTGAFAYGMGQHHKHLPEIVKYTGLTRRPVFAPMVGQYAQGMIVEVALHLEGRTLARLHEALADHYAGQDFVRVVAAETYGARIDPQRMNGTNRMELSVHGDDAAGTAMLVAVLDNLGKGASGAAVQNLNLMLGLPETIGLEPV
jgi:N-acetyl-gamma-glutamyl-phosphate reductase